MKSLFLTITLTIVVSYSSFAQWTTSGTNIYNSNTGNVGIGTTTPAYLLDVKGVASFGAPIMRVGDGTVNYGWYVGAGSINAQFGTISNHNMLLFANSLTVLTLNASGTSVFSGNAGILAQPRTNLEVNTGTATGATILTANNGTAGSSATPVYLRNDFVGYNYAGYGPNARIEVRDRGSSFAYSDMNFLVRNQSFTLTSALFIDGAAGHIGIGTTTPQNMLHITGNVGGQYILHLDNTDATDGRVAIQFSSAKGPQSWEFGENVGGGIGLFGLRDITTTGFPIRFMVNTAGNFGIGTTSPSSLLTVGNNASSLTGQQASIVYLPTATSGSFGGTVSQTMVNTTVASAAPYYGIWAESGDNTGVTSDFTRFAGLIAIGGGITHRGTGTVTGTASIYAGPASSTNGGIITTAYGLYINAIKGTGVTNSYGVYQSSATDLNYFAGNLGIGTTAPGAKLQIVGTGSNMFIDNNQFSANRNPLTGTAVDGTKGSSAITLNTSTVGGNLQFFTNATTGGTVSERMRITESGAVCIGTTTPFTYMFAVAGTAIATAVTVKTVPNWPDYVFKKHYRLPPLSEVKTYIDKNQHLPEVPTEQQIAKDGLNLGEMNRVLVKKVEELTLYMIEKDTQLKEQDERIKKLEQQVQLLLNKEK